MIIRINLLFLDIKLMATTYLRIWCTIIYNYVFHNICYPVGQISFIKCFSFLILPKRDKIFLIGAPLCYFASSSCKEGVVI